MRAENETIYRGKREDNDEWVEGFYCLAYNFDPPAQQRACIQYYRPNKSAGYYCALVKPETIGLYSTYDDAKKQKIFEGDYIKSPCVNAVGLVRFGKYSSERPNFRSDKNVGFYVEWVCSENAEDVNRLAIDLGFWAEDEEVVVIGNAHDMSFEDVKRVVLKDKEGVISDEKTRIV